MSASPHKLHLIYGQEKSRQGSRCWLQNKFWKNVGWSQKSTSIAATLECLQSKWLCNPFSRKAASALAGFWYFAILPNFGAKAWFTGVQYTQYKVRFGKHKLLSLSIQSHYEIQSHYVIALNGPSVSQSPIAILYYMWMECWSWRWYFLQSNNIWSLLGCKSGQNWPSFVSCQLKHVAHKFRVLFLL